MIAIIPARGGSKGLPGKNIYALHGKPLIAYTIEAALKSEEVDRVVVSTDDTAIAEVAGQFGAEVPFLRPASLAEDDSPAMDAYIYTVNRINQEENKDIHEFIVLLPTAPLRTSKDIDDAIRLFRSKKADSVISVCPARHSPQWYKKIENGVLQNYFEGSDSLKNRQDLDEAFRLNGSIYVFTLELLKQGKYYSDKTYAYIMPENRSVDIDDLHDLEYAEYLMSKYGS